MVTLMEDPSKDLGGCKRFEMEKASINIFSLLHSAGLHREMLVLSESKLLLLLLLLPLLQLRLGLLRP